MAFDGLADFIKAAADAGAVQQIDGADLERDVGCLTKLFAERKGPMLVFDRFAGFPAGFQVCSNALRTPRRLALAMGFPLDAHPIALVKLWKECRKKLNAVAPVLQSDMLLCVSAALSAISSSG